MASPLKFLLTKRRFLALVLLFIALIHPVSLTQQECPLDCTCSVQPQLHDGNTVIGQHAICTSLDGLKLVGRTSTLQSLNLSHIGITKITNQLDKLKNLTAIDLSFNRLSEVSKMNRRIKTLNLSHNRITSGKLAKIPLYIQHLNLSHNEITYLPLEFKKLQSLRTIELSGNPINCTCETLEVRNWLQENHVWTDNHVKCMAPLRFKGRPWLQIRQADACGHRDLRPRVMPYRHQLTDDDNDIMLSVQPSLVDLGSLENADEELGKDFLLVRQKKHADAAAGYDAEESSGEDVFRSTSGYAPFDAKDGEEDSSGSITEKPFLGFAASNIGADEDDDGSGSGGGIFVMPSIKIIDDDANEDVFDENQNTKSESPLPEPFEETTPEPKLNLNLNIFAGRKQEEIDMTSKSPVIEESISSKKVSDISATTSPKLETEHLQPSSESDEHSSQQVVPAKIGNGLLGVEGAESKEESENKNTYILLAILLVLLVGLIAYVAFKRSNNNSNNNRRNDAENPRSTELQDMDKKKALGKPLQKNGNHEQKPLLNEKPKSDASIIGANKYPPTTNNFQSPEFKAQTEPLLKKEPSEPMTTFKSVEEAVPRAPQSEDNNNIPSNGHIESPVPAARNPVASEPIPVHQSPQNGQSPSSLQQDINDDRYAPVSPRPARYSPVYSPETGRVKIKLTETAKPKTPLLVTRSRSNAGDIITTPNLNQRLSKQS